MAGVEVTFTKVAGRRYRVTVRREHGPRLAPRHGPGYHDHLPHDAVHFLVECEARMSGGVFGRIAQGHSNLFWAAEPRDAQRQRRRDAKRRITPQQHADMQASEALATVCQALWEARAGLPARAPSPSDLASRSMDGALVERILGRLDAFAAAWHALPVDGSITVAWPLRAPPPGGSQARTRRAAVQRRVVRTPARGR